MSEGLDRRAKLTGQEHNFDYSKKYDQAISELKTLCPTDIKSRQAFDWRGYTINLYWGICGALFSDERGMRILRHEIQSFPMPPRSDSASFTRVEDITLSGPFAQQNLARGAALNRNSCNSALVEAINQLYAERNRAYEAALKDPNSTSILEDDSIEVIVRNIAIRCRVNRMRAEPRLCIYEDSIDAFKQLVGQINQEQAAQQVAVGEGGKPSTKRKPENFTVRAAKGGGGAAAAL